MNTDRSGRTMSTALTKMTPITRTAPPTATTQMATATTTRERGNNNNNNNKNSNKQQQYSYRVFVHLKRRHFTLYGDALCVDVVYWRKCVENIEAVV